MLNREFNVAAPNQTWTTNITYLGTCEGWLYVVAVLDLFSRRIVGWAIDSHMKESLVSNAMYMAFLIDQVQQLCCSAYQNARNHVGGLRYLFEKIRHRIDITGSLEKQWHSVKKTYTVPPIKIT
ncbi:hypothetical protein BH10PSE19_BH10PSE19_21940 [soil metagenome]